MRPCLSLVLLLALALPAGASPQIAPEWGEVAARGGEATLSWPELDELLLARHAMGEDGRAALKQLLRARLLDRLAKESKLEVTPAMVQARWKEIDAEVVAAAQAESLEAYLESEGVDRDVFREFLRLAIVQETLARRALGVAEGRPVNAEQQEMWLDQVMEQRGTQMPAPPWADGIAARCGDVSVSARDYTLFLRTQLPSDAVRDACYQRLLEQRVRARMPDLAPETLAQAVEEELVRRREEVAGDPRYKGLSYEQVLAAQGLQLGSLRGDPSVVCAALARLWVDRTWGEEGVREVYRDERAFFDGVYGEAREVRWVFLRAGMFKNRLVSRSFEEGELELARLAEGVSGYPDFLRLVAEHTEDSGSRDREGLIGWVPQGDVRIPQPIRDAAFSDGGRDLGEGRLVGPVRLATGVALLWIGARRPAPGWEFMREAVHRELRRRFLEECLPRSSVVTYLDP